MWAYKGCILSFHKNKIVFAGLDISCKCALITLEARTWPLVPTELWTVLQGMFAIPLASNSVQTLPVAVRLTGRTTCIPHTPSFCQILSANNKPIRNLFSCHKNVYNVLIQVQRSTAHRDNEIIFKKRAQRRAGRCFYEVFAEQLL